MWTIGKAVLLVVTLTGITIANSMTLGLYTIGLPRIAADINLADNLLLWFVVMIYYESLKLSFSFSLVVQISFLNVTRIFCTNSINSLSLLYL